MKVTESQVALWMKDAVTEAFMESIRRVREHDISFVIDGNCITQELYHRSIGVLDCQALFLSPLDVMREQDMIVIEEDK